MGKKVGPTLGELVLGLTVDARSFDCCRDMHIFARCLRALTYEHRVLPGGPLPRNPIVGLQQFGARPTDRSTARGNLAQSKVHSSSLSESSKQAICEHYTS